MGFIHWHSDPGSRGTKDKKFIQCFYVRETQIHKLWCLGLEDITCKLHPTSRVEIGAVPVGEFINDYLAENGRRILIIRQKSINGSVQFLGIPDFIRGGGFSFFFRLASSH